MSDNASMRPVSKKFHTSCLERADTNPTTQVSARLTPRSGARLAWTAIMPKRKLEDSGEWDEQKDSILRLYIDEDKPLKNVMELMDDRGFRRTKPQYERMFRDWGVSKNIRENEWKFIFSRIDEREAVGKKSIVKVRGAPISQAKLQKQRSRQRQPVFDLHVALCKPCARPEGIQGIKIYTPGSSPSREIEVEFDKERYGPSSNASDIEEEIPILDIQYTAELNSTTSLEIPATLTYTSTSTSRQNLHSPMQTCASLQRGTHGPLTESAQAVVPVKQLPAIVLQWLSLIPSLPMDGLGLDVEIEKILSQRLGTSREILKRVEDSLFKLIAERLNSDKAVMLTISRARNEDSLEALRYLFNLSETTGDVHLKDFAENLFIPAAVAGNLPLIVTLLDFGVDANIRMHYTPVVRHSYTHSDKFDLSGMYNRFIGSDATALQIAVYNRREDIIQTLLQRGANDWHANILGPTGYVSCSILDMVMELGNRGEWMVNNPEEKNSISRHILETLLRFGYAYIQDAEVMLSRALIHAVLQDRRDLVDILYTYCPGLLEIAKSKPWMSLEAASTLKNPGMVNFLIESGFDLTSTTSDGLGSVIAAAAKQSNASRITYLVGKNADVNAVGYGRPHSAIRQNSATISEARLEGINRLTALQIAVQKKDWRLIRLLLYHGAELGRFGTLEPVNKTRFPLTSPICYDGNEELNNMLSKARFDDVCVAFAKTTQHINTDTPSLRIFRTAYWLEALCDAILDSDPLHVKQLLDDAKSLAIEHKNQRGIRALVLATRRKNGGLIHLFLQAGISPFERLDPGRKGFQDLDERLAFLDHESAFELALMLHQKTAVQDFAMLSIESLDSEQKIARRRQLSTAYASAICDEDLELQDIIKASSFDVDRIDRDMGPNYVQQRLHFALQHAAASKQYIKLERLLMAGANPNSPNNNTADTSGVLTPLQYAVKHNNIYVVGRMLQAGADVNAPPHPIEGRTALQLAASIGNLEMVDVLLEAKADVNAPPAAYKGRTAIEAAAEYGHIWVFYRLLLDGADIIGRDCLIYRRVKHLARTNKHFMLQDWAFQEVAAKGWHIRAVDRCGPITKDELDFASFEAKQEYEALLRENDHRSDDEESDADDYNEHISQQS